jgi:hypothetical protein
MVRKIILQ